jgi:biotin/methionine sulfoxide reductase
MINETTKVTSSHWGAFKITASGGQIVSTSPFEQDLTPPEISRAIPAAVHHRSRVTRPSIRKGWLQNRGRAREQRGSDQFIELSWDEALDIAAAELKRVQGNFGNSAIFGGSYGWASAGRFHHAQGQIHRFLNTIGGYVSSFGSYSTAAAQAIIPHIFGMDFHKFGWEHQNSWSLIAEHTQSLVMFGGINPKNSQVSMGGVTRHETATQFDAIKRRGVRCINISPQQSDAPPGAEWLPIIPGTDTAMMLAVAWVLETESLLDREFVDRCTTGYVHFRSYLLGETDGQPKSPVWASALCGIDPKVIEELARHMVDHRTLITVAWSLQRAENGEQPYWMAATLAAMLGQIGLPGGGIGYGYGAIGGIGVSIKQLGGITFPQGKNPIRDFIPVARIADMLLSPGVAYDFNGKRRHYPDIKLVYWCGGNPFHHHQDLNRLQEAFQQPDTIIVNEPWWTATAQRADIVFPATTSYEREDIGWAQGDAYLFHMPQMISPVHESRNDYQIFSGLAERLGVSENFSEGRDSEQWQQYLYEEFERGAKEGGVDVPSLEELKKSNWVELPILGPEYSDTPFADFRCNPQRFPLGTPSGKIEIYSSCIAGFNYPEDPGHPVWRCPVEWLGTERADKFPLHLISPQPGDKLHSQLECAIADSRDQRPALLSINPLDANRRQIDPNMIVRVFNNRGTCLAEAVLTDAVREGVVALPTGAWFTPGNDATDTQGNPNVLTQDRGTSRIGQGSSAHSTLVDVAPA